MGKKYTVIQDTREKERFNKWHFPVSSSCNGTRVDTLKTGDYTLEGYEEIFTLERKGKLSEFATNVNEARFWKELERMEAFKYPFLLLEFELSDILKWPHGAGIPFNKIKDIKTTPAYILMKLNEILVKYKVKVIFAGSDGLTIASSLFKRIVEHGR